MRAKTINEIRRNGDVITSLSVGKTHMINRWMESLGLDPRKASLNDNGTVDYEGDVHLFDRGLTNLASEEGFKFGRVTGNFICDGNLLTTLDGAPYIVSDSFICDGNLLTWLVGSPYYVGGNFLCSDNRLTSLEGAPKSIEGGFFCYRNQLTSLKGSPRIIKIDFDCSGNRLKSLEGAPVEVGGNFVCSENSNKFVEEDVASLCKVGNKIIT